MDAAQLLDFADEARTLTLRQTAGGNQAVDEQPQLGVGELVLDIPAGAEGAVLAVGAGARPFVTTDGIAAALQLKQVAPDRLAVGCHPVFGFEEPQQLLLGKAVVFVGVLPQQLKQVEGEHLFRLQRIGHSGESFRFCRWVQYTVFRCEKQALTEGDGKGIIKATLLKSDGATAPSDFSSVRTKNARIAGQATVPLWLLPCIVRFALKSRSGLVGQKALQVVL